MIKGVDMALVQGQPTHVHSGPPSPVANMRWQRAEHPVRVLRSAGDKNVQDVTVAKS